MATFAERMIGAAKLQAATYEEVEADRGATGQALGVVVLASVATGIGSAGQGVAGVVIWTLVALLGWVLWAALIYLVGVRLMPEEQTRADVGELLRCIGFAYTPGVLRILGFVPAVGAVISFAASVWILVAMVVGVRQALDYTSTVRAVVVCVIGFVAYMAVAVIVGVVAGLGSATLSSVGG